jgi:hypothetical protein
MLRSSLALSAAAVFLLAAPSSGSGGPDAAHPVTVGSSRLAAAPPAVMEQRVQAAWLRDEARGLGLPAGPDLRMRVADALAGVTGRGIPGAFNRFHERHRAATRCLPAATDPYADRCIDQPPAPAGSCRWMGEATLCRVQAGGGRTWLVVRRSGGSRRFGRHRRAIAEGRRIYLRAREGRERVVREALAERSRLRAAAERRHRLAQAQAARRRVLQARRARLADPRLSAASLAPARRACVLFGRDAELYAFGIGTQDPAGQANGLLAARAALERRLGRAAADRVDRRKLAPLLRALRGGDAQLRRLRVARELEHVYAARDRYLRVARRAGRVGARLGLPDCAG